MSDTFDPEDVEAVKLLRFLLTGIDLTIYGTGCDSCRSQDTFDISFKHNDKWYRIDAIESFDSLTKEERRKQYAAQTKARLIENFRRSKSDV